MSEVETRLDFAAAGGDLSTSFSTPMDSLEGVPAGSGAADPSGRGPLRVSVTVPKSAGEDVGLAYLEEDAGLTVTGCKGALRAASEGGGPRVLSGDRLLEVNGVAGGPAILRVALSAARASAEVVLVLERTQTALENELLEAINDRDWPRVSQGLLDFRAGAWSVPTALLAGLLRLAHKIGEGPSALAALDSINLNARELAEVLTMDALARDDLLAAAGQILGMRRDGHPIPMELAAQFCSTGLQAGRLQEVLPVLPVMGLGPEELLVLLKLCQAHDQDPTARFLQLYECCILHQERLLAPRAPPGPPLADDRRVEWLSRQVVAQAERMARAHGELLSRVCFQSWAAQRDGTVARLVDLRKGRPCPEPIDLGKITDAEVAWRLLSAKSRRASLASASTADSKDDSDSSSGGRSPVVELAGPVGEPAGAQRSLKRTSKGSELCLDASEAPADPNVTKAVPAKARPMPLPRFASASPQPVNRAPGFAAASPQPCGRVPGFASPSRGPTPCSVRASVPPPRSPAPLAPTYAAGSFSPGARAATPARAASGLQSSAVRAREHQNLEGMPRSSTPYMQVPPTRGANLVPRFSK
jgi:hypothetical protein